MKSVLMRLQGPVQGWSTRIKLGIRDTDSEPSKSGVIGMVASALGMERDDDRTLASLRDLVFAVRVDRAGTLLREFQTAGGGSFRGQSYSVFGAAVVPSDRYLLQDACFTAALGGDHDLVERVAQALQSPRWPLFLGRRACVPSAPVFLGLSDAAPAVAVRKAAIPERSDEGPLRLVVEVPSGQGEPRYDVPLSFREGERAFGLRHVRTEWLDVGSGNMEAEGGLAR